MNAVRTSSSAPGIAALRRFSRPTAPTPEEVCELCHTVLAPSHRHLLETPTRRIVCACDPCALCFQGVVGGRYRLVPRDVRWLPDFAMDAAQWQGLALPIDLAFFVHDTAAGRVVAFYPGPAGAIESSLPLATWSELVAGNPALGAMEPDVEALLANRLGGRPRYYLAPIDTCFHLVGLIRLHWRGLAGGADVWREIDAFFAGFTPAAAQAEEAGCA